MLNLYLLKRSVADCLPHCIGITMDMMADAEMNYLMFGTAIKLCVPKSG